MVHFLKSGLNIQNASTSIPVCFVRQKPLKVLKTFLANLTFLKYAHKLSIQECKKKLARSVQIRNQMHNIKHCEFVSLSVLSSILSEQPILFSALTSAVCLHNLPSGGRAEAGAWLGPQ